MGTRDERLITTTGKRDSNNREGEVCNRENMGTLSNGLQFIEGGL